MADINAYLKKALDGTAPQHQKGNRFVITGESNPLPVADHVLTEGGVWIPQRGSDDGAAHTQVTGSIVEVHILANAESFTDTTSKSFVIKKDIIRRFKEIEVVIRNTHDKEIYVGFDNVNRYRFRTESGDLQRYAETPSLITHTIPANTSDRTSLDSFPAMFGDDPAVNPSPYKSLILKSGTEDEYDFVMRARAHDSPTSGAFTAYLIGVK